MSFEYVLPQDEVLHGSHERDTLSPPSHINASISTVVIQGATLRTASSSGKSACERFSPKPRQIHSVAFPILELSLPKNILTSRSADRNDCRVGKSTLSCNCVKVLDY